MHIGNWKGWRITTTCCDGRKFRQKEKRVGQGRERWRQDGASVDRVQSQCCDFGREQGVNAWRLSRNVSCERSRESG